MAVRFQIPRVLESCIGGSKELQLAVASLGELREALRNGHADLYQSLFDEAGSLRRHINLFHNDHLLDRSDFATPLCPGDVVMVFQAVSGG